MDKLNQILRVKYYLECVQKIPGCIGFMFKQINSQVDKFMIHNAKICAMMFKFNSILQIYIQYIYAFISILAYISKVLSHLQSSAAPELLLVRRCLGDVFVCFGDLLGDLSATTEFEIYKHAF